MNAFFLILALVAHAEKQECKHDQKTFRCLKYVRNYDADTITFDIPGTHPIIGNNISVRVLGIDTPEIRGKTKCEKKLAKEAKLYVQGIMQSAKKIELQRVKKGKYFRLVGDVVVDGESLTKKLIKKKYGYEYYGKKKQKIDWCKTIRTIASEKEKK